MTLQATLLVNLLAVLNFYARAHFWHVSREKFYVTSTTEIFLTILQLDHLSLLCFVSKRIHFYEALERHVCKNDIICIDSFESFLSRCRRLLKKLNATMLKLSLIQHVSREREREIERATGLLKSWRDFFSYGHVYYESTIKYSLKRIFRFRSFNVHNNKSIFTSCFININIKWKHSKLDGKRDKYFERLDEFEMNGVKPDDRWTLIDWKTDDRESATIVLQNWFFFFSGKHSSQML